MAQVLKERGVDYKDFEPVGGSKAMGDMLHHPHVHMADHEHSHMDGTFHSHDHHHGDGSLHHDTLGHEASMHAGVPGYGVRKEITNAHKTKPSQYSHVPDAKFLDTANFKYPITSEFIKAAHSYFNQEGQKEKGGYSDSQWAAMGGKLAKALGEGYRYENGKVVGGDKSLFKADGESDTPKEKKRPDTTDEPEDEADDKPEDANKKEIHNLRAAIVAMGTQMVEMKGLLAAMAGDNRKSNDDRVADFFTAKVAKLPRGVEASQSDGNIKAHDPSMEAKDQGSDLSWFQNFTVGDMKVTK
jgi:hypothetical protein